MERGNVEDGPGGAVVCVCCPVESGLSRSWSLLGKVCEKDFTPPDWAPLPSIASRCKLGELFSEIIRSINFNVGITNSD